ncbi:MAG: hypothetical protein QW767_03970 [Thermoprotei archaeon]
MPHEVRLEDGKLIIVFHGLETLEAFKRRMEFPVEHITSVSTSPHKWVEGLKLVGARLPGVVTEGIFLVDGKKVFFAMHHPESCVTVELAGEAYSALVVDVDDKQRVAEEIAKATGLNVSD